MVQQANLINKQMELGKQLEEANDDDAMQILDLSPFGIKAPKRGRNRYNAR
jgi:hypothetical protein